MEISCRKLYKEHLDHNPRKGNDEDEHSKLLPQLYIVQWVLSECTPCLFDKDSMRFLYIKLTDSI